MCAPCVIRVRKSRRIRWAEYAARMGGRRVACRNLVGKSKGKRQLERTNATWEANNKTDLSEVGWGCVDWIDLVHDKNRWRALVK